MTLPPNIICLANIYLQRIGSSTILRSDTLVQVFYRVESNGEMYYSEKYGRVRCRNSYTVTFLDAVRSRKFGLIQYFFVSPGTTVLPLVVVKACTTTLQCHFDLTVSSVKHLESTIIPVEESVSFYVIDLNQLEKKCLYVSFPRAFHDKYVIIFPNKLYTFRSFIS